MGGPLVCVIYPHLFKPRMILGRSTYPRLLATLQALQRHPVRAPITCRALSQSVPLREDSRSGTLPPRDGLNSIEALEERVLRELLDTGSPPPEAGVLLALQACQSYATFRLKKPPNSPADATPTSALLSLDEGRMAQAVGQPSTPSPPLSHKPVPGLSAIGKLMNSMETAPVAPKSTPPNNFGRLTDLAYKIVSHPSVFITIPILASYVSLQSLVRDPSPIPAVFSLYANKPFTPPGSPKLRYPNPQQVKYAIPSNIASIALDAAIEAKDMSICLDIVDTSYGAPAFQRSKLIRRATPAAVAGCLTPVAIYAVADIMAGYQDEVDHSLAVKYAFAGILAYVCFTGSIGIVALMTANDQMVRVTWIAGTPLKYRWLREEERAALDRIAQAWGFTETNKRGLEEGDEWELLREVVNRKGMYLDNPTLMEGME